MSDRQSVELVWMPLIILLCFAFTPAAWKDDTKPDRCVCVCGASVNMDGHAL